MKNKILLLTIITGLLLTGCTSTNNETQDVPETPAVVEPQTSVDELEVPYEGEEVQNEEVEPEVQAEETETDVEDSEETGETDETDETETEGSQEVEVDIVEVEVVEKEETSSTATETTTETSTNKNETTTTTTSTTVETTPSGDSVSSSTTDSDTTTESNVTTGSTTTNTNTSTNTSTNTNTTTTNENINSYVDFYILDMNGNPVQGATTKFDFAISTTGDGGIPSSVTDVNGKTRTQLVKSDIGLPFASAVSITYDKPFKANITVLDSNNPNKNISYIENSVHSYVTNTDTASFNANGATTISDGQLVKVVIMMDFSQEAISSNTSSSTNSNSTNQTVVDTSTTLNPSSDSATNSSANINSTLMLDLQNYSYDYDNQDFNNSTNYNKVKVEIQLLSRDRKQSEMITIYDDESSYYGSSYTFKENQVDWLIGSLIKVTANHQFELVAEFDTTDWRDTGAVASSSANGDGTHYINLRDTIDEDIQHGKNFNLYIRMDNKGELSR